jgi:GT2 family glycosyltransferase
MCLDLSIVIVSYNVSDYLSLCLDSISKYIDGNKFKYEVIVVDNCSTDKTVEILENSYRNVKLIKNEFNYGFSVANNIGVKESSGDFILLLNPDIYFLSDPIGCTMDCFKESEKIGALSYRLLNSDLTPQATIGVYPSLFTKFCYLFGVKHILKSSFARRTLSLLRPLLGRQVDSYLSSFECNDELVRVETLPGAFMLIRRSCFDSVGGFDEEFFLYSEDIDLCKRMGELGWELYLSPGQPVVHHEGKSFVRKDKGLSPERYRGEFYYFLKHHGIVQFVLFFFMVLTSLFLKFLYLAVHRLFLREKKVGLSQYLAYMWNVVGVAKVVLLKRKLTYE